MALPKSGAAREYDKFVEDGAGDVAIRTKLSAGSSTIGTVNVAPGTDFEGAPVTVGTTAVELTFTGATKSIMIQADPDNVGKVWVGKSNVTNAGANAMVQLEAGDAVSIDLDDSSNAIYVVSDTASQNVFKMALI